MGHNVTRGWAVGTLLFIQRHTMATKAQKVHSTHAAMNRAVSAANKKHPASGGR